MPHPSLQHPICTSSSSSYSTHHCPSSSSLFLKKTNGSSSNSCKQPLSPLAGCDGRRIIFNLSSSNLNKGDCDQDGHGGHFVSSGNTSGSCKLSKTPNKTAVLGGTSSLTSSLASICSLAGTGAVGTGDGGHTATSAIMATRVGGVSSLARGRHYNLQAASSSLLESYVNGSDSPLRNLYCQCKHHAAE